MTRYTCTLADCIHERQKDTEYFDSSQIARIMVDIVRGVKFLHTHSVVSIVIPSLTQGKQVIHRDIKPENLFVMKNHLGEIQNVALGDFDQAIEVEAEQKLTECVGTPV